MNKTELKKLADSVFKRHANVDKVFATSDGQVFFEEAHAKNHAAPSKKHKELEVTTFRRKEKEDLDIEDMDRVQLEAFVKDNKLDVAFYAETPDEDLRTMIVNAIEVAAKTTKTSKKVKK
ncbi:MAG: hypothetical protein E6767_18890 [Dysgonomonas sp.]|nr:hypothetical protein [Dysgonomonas sp.]